MAKLHRYLMCSVVMNENNAKSCTFGGPLFYFISLNSVNKNNVNILDAKNDRRNLNNKRNRKIYLFSRMFYHI